MDPLDPTKISPPGPPGGSVRLIDRRHPEWGEFNVRWRWLMDSYEGGQRYREAIYGVDARGIPVRNLIRHKREYPDPREQTFANTSTYLGGTATTTLAFGEGVGGKDQAQFAADDDYELRRARTPVPTFLPEAISTHLGEIYAKEIRRDFGAGLDDLAAWMEDVDGKGTDFATWMQEDVAPVLLAVGQLDLLFDHPMPPEGASVVTRADSDRLKLGGCVASMILSENMLWWRLNPDGTYQQCLVLEYLDPDDPASNKGYRHWTAAESVLYSGGTSGSEMEEISRTAHDFGRVPIVRLMDRRKPRCRNVGQSRYESIAERQREYYNRDSELILSDSTQAHPLLQGPEDFVQADGMIPIGPSWLLPKKKNTQGGSTSYEGFEVVDFPKGTSESIRSNMQVIRDDVDRDAALTKPAGANGTSGGTVSQSGISKAMDSKTGTRKLASIAASLARAEGRIFAFALACLRDDPDAIGLASEIEVVYPTDYNLFSAAELAQVASDIQDLLKQSGDAPETEVLLITQLIRAALPGFDDSTYEKIQAEIEAAIGANAARKDEMAEGPPGDGRMAAGQADGGGEFEEDEAPEVAVSDKSA